jgi:adenylate kinase
MGAASSGQYARLVLFGAPGAGKGTQAAELKKELKVPHIATGDLLRAAMKAESEVGRRVRGLMDRGELVPDDLVSAMIAERLGAPDTASGFILDGFPRTLEQANFLDRFLADAGITLDGVVNLEVPEAEIIERLAWRRICSSCGTIFHLKFNPPRDEGRCDECGQALNQRADDREAAVAERLKVYRSQTEPVVAHYRDQGLLVTIDGRGRRADIAARIRGAIPATAR